MKMKLGQLVVTRGINGKIADDTMFSKFVFESLKKYVSGDWGDTCKEDSALNDAAFENDDRIVAKYKNESRGDIFIITEWDRSVTTVLFCHEY